jgi:hypothetical protein
MIIKSFYDFMKRGCVANLLSVQRRYRGKRPFVDGHESKDRHPMTTQFHPPLPDELAQVSEQWWAAYCEAAAGASVTPPQDSAFIMAIKRVWALSDFVGRVCQRDPQVLPDCMPSGDLEGPYPSDRLSAKLSAALQPLAAGLASHVPGALTDRERDPLDELQQRLRRFRNR